MARVTNLERDITIGDRDVPCEGGRWQASRREGGGEREELDEVEPGWLLV